MTYCNKIANYNYITKFFSLVYNIKKNKSNNKITNKQTQ